MMNGKELRTLGCVIAFMAAFLSPLVIVLGIMNNNPSLFIVGVIVLMVSLAAFNKWVRKVYRNG